MEVVHQQCFPGCVLKAFAALVETEQEGEGCKREIIGPAGVHAHSSRALKPPMANATPAKAGQRAAAEQAWRCVLGMVCGETGKRRIVSATVECVLGGEQSMKVQGKGSRRKGGGKQGANQSHITVLWVQVLRLKCTSKRRTHKHKARCT